MYLSDYDASKAVCPKCGKVGTRVFLMPGVHYKGLGFYSTDKWYAEQLKEAENIADHQYEARAEMADDKISEDDDFFNELAKREYHKDQLKGTLFSPPTTVIPEYEAKTGNNIADGTAGPKPIKPTSQTENT